MGRAVPNITSARARDFRQWLGNVDGAFPHTPRHLAEGKDSPMDMPSMQSHTCTAKSVSEYPLPAASMTHELAQIGGQNLLAVSQMDNNTLLKVAIDPATGRPQAVAAFQLGSMMGGLHGLVASKAYPGQIWCTFQFDNKLALVDPGNGLDTSPIITQEIAIPAPGRGPHGIIEEGPNL